MRLRARIALALAASFVIGGTAVLLISATTYEHAVYQTQQEQSDALLKQIGVSRSVVDAYLRQHPEVVRNFDTSAPLGDGRPSVDEAFQATQRASRRAGIVRARWLSAAALAVMGLLAALVGWVAAGRGLGALRRITSRARSVSAAELGAPVALDRPHDEIRELGDTFDDMLARLEGAFTAQRRFSSQVSHELRTPLAIISAEVDLLRSDAEPRHAKSLEEIRGATERAERIIAALLALARSGSGDLTPERLELGVLVGDVLGEMVNGAEWRGLRVELDLAEAPVRADKALVERLVTNMLANAARHNRPEGWVEVRTCVHDAWAVIEVENSTSPSFMPTEDTARRRGIGLTVVDAVLAAHGGHLTVEEPASDRRLTRASLPCAGVQAEPATLGLGADR